MSGKLKSFDVGRYSITKHALYRIGERDISRDEVIHNLCRKPVARTKSEVGKDGRPSYRRYSDSLMTLVNPKDKTVVTTRGYHESEAKSMGIKNHRSYRTQTEVDRAKAKTKSVRSSSTPRVSRTVKSKKTTRSTGRPARTRRRC